MSVENGYLFVASVFPEYVNAAEYSAASVKDHNPNAHTTLFVPKALYRESLKKEFDHIVTDGVPDHTRTKLYALSRTPYKNLTLYVDADMECMHSDVSKVWDEIGPDTDILITRIRPYNGKIAKWKNGEMIYHGGFFLYRSNQRTLTFMERWWQDYQLQRSSPWPYSEDEAPIALRPWDQFTFWKLQNIDKLPISVDVFEDDARWNFVNGYHLTETSSPVVFYHHTVPMMRNKEIAARTQASAIL